MAWNLKRICISGHWIEPPIIFEVNISQKDIGRISKIVNFHPIALKFEEELHNWSLISTTNDFWGQICFMDFASVVLCTTSSSCYFVCLSPAGHNSKPIFIKLYQVVEGVSTEKPIDFEFKGQRSSCGRNSKIVIFHPINLN